MATTDAPLNNFRIRQMSREDIPAIIALQLRAFPGLPPWRPDQLERHLAENRYLAGEYLTEADIRLFTTLIRFDAVY